MLPTLVASHHSHAVWWILNIKVLSSPLPHEGRCAFVCSKEDLSFVSCNANCLPRVTSAQAVCTKGYDVVESLLHFAL